MTSTTFFKTATPSNRVTSRDVVATRTAGALDVVTNPSLGSSVDGALSSVMPSGARLNGPATISQLNVLNPSSEDFTGAMAERDIGAVPVGDYIKHTSFKTGSKLIIRIVQMSATSTSVKSKFGENKSNRDIFAQAGLQAVNEISEEKFQLYEGFDSHKLLMFGRKPKIWNFQLMVLNGARPGTGEGATAEEYEAENMDFADELYRRYEAYYAGTKAVEADSRVFLSYEDRIIEGYLVNMTLARNSQAPAVAPMNMVVVVTHDSFSTNSLAPQDNMSINDLLDQKKESEEMATSLSPTELVNAVLTPEQRQAIYEENQSNTAEAQSRASDLREQALRAKDLQRQAATMFTAVQDIKQQAQDDLVLAESEADKAHALGLIAEMEARERELVAMQQDLGKTAAQAEGPLTFMGDQAQMSALEEVTKQLDAAEHAQKSMENNMKFSTEGDLTSAYATDKTFTDILQTYPDGTRHLFSYVTNDNDLSNEIFLDEEGGVTLLIGERDVSDNPEYDDIPDGKTTRLKRVFSK